MYGTVIPHGPGDTEYPIPFKVILAFLSCAVKKLVRLAVKDGRSSDCFVESVAL